MARDSRSARCTLSDVARLAGVSPTTVSLVLGNKAERHRISQEVLERVRNAASELDYTPNRLVHSMQRGYTRILSFFSGFRNRVAHDLYRDTLSTAIERAAGKQGYDILINCNYSRTPEETYRHLNGGIVDGILFFAPMIEDPLLPYLRSSRLPSVLINGRDSEGVLSSVRDDVESGMRQVANRLVELGHRHIVALTEPHIDNPDQNERIALLRSHLAPHGIDVHILPGGPGISPAHLVQTIVSDPAGFTAVFCWRDFLAYQILEACETLRIQTPGQLSIVGYDGLTWPAATSQTVTSVYVDLDLLAQESVQLLAQQIGQEPQPISRMIPVSLCKGGTLAAAPDASSVGKEANHRQQHKS